jgi:predicted SAM-dependent methyltransferase
MDDIQKQTRDIHNQYFEKMMMKRCKEKGLKVLDLGGAIGKPDGFQSVDRHDADIICDLNEKRDLEDNSVGYIRAHHIFEHLKSPIHVMGELYRVLYHG